MCAGPVILCNPDSISEPKFNSTPDVFIFIIEICHLSGCPVFVEIISTVFYLEWQMKILKDHLASENVDIALLKLEFDV